MGIISRKRLLSSPVRGCYPMRGWAARVAITLAVFGAIPRAADANVRDIQLVGLPPLYMALEAVGSCPGLAVNQRRFAAAALSYHLTSDDLTIDGRFPDLIADLSNAYRVRIRDDRNAFCSAARLQFVVRRGILSEETP